MTRVLIILLALLLAALGWRSWLLSNAREAIELQRQSLQDKTAQLARVNSQLIGLAILTGTNNREQARLYAAAEKNSELLRQRQCRIEELKNENQALRQWADTLLPADISRLRERPALNGGAAYREWLSQSDPLPAN